MTGSIYLEVTGLIHSALGGQSVPGFHVSQTTPKKQLQKTPHHEVPGQLVNWCTVTQFTSKHRFSGY